MWVNETSGIVLVFNVYLQMGLEAATKALLDAGEATSYHVKKYT